MARSRRCQKKVSLNIYLLDFPGLHYVCTRFDRDFTKFDRVIWDLMGSHLVFLAGGWVVGAWKKRERERVLWNKSRGTSLTSYHTSGSAIDGHFRLGIKICKLDTMKL